MSCALSVPPGRRRFMTYTPDPSRTSTSAVVARAAVDGFAHRRTGNLRTILRELALRRQALTQLILAIGDRLRKLC